MEDLKESLYCIDDYSDLNLHGGLRSSNYTWLTLSVNVKDSLCEGRRLEDFEDEPQDEDEGVSGESETAESETE